MKAYVNRYGPIDKGAERRPGDSPEDTHEIFVRRYPEWKMTKEEAESECFILNTRLHFHFGSHRCTFSVEELLDGQFAIVCLNHPDGSV